MQHEHQLAPHDNVPTRPGATDPVCGMDVDRESVLTLEHDGTAYHFCSQRCRDRFQQDPSAYAQAVGGPGGIPPRPRQCGVRSRSGPARCIPRSADPAPGRARSVGWPWNRSLLPLTPGPVRNWPT